MTAYLAYSQSTCLTEQEQLDIDQKTKKSRKEFSKGFVKGTSISLVAYSLYSLATSAAYAADSKVPAPQNPGNTPLVPQPKPTDRPGFRPLNDGSKGLFAGGAGGICGAVAQSGDFYLGLACAFILIVGSLIMNRPDVDKVCKP